MLFLARKIYIIVFRDVAQSGSAPHWGCGGRRFKSGHPDQFIINYLFLIRFLKYDYQNQKSIYKKNLKNYI